MKRYFLVALAIILCISSVTLTGCDTTESDRENQVKNQIYSYYEDIKQKMIDSKDTDEFAGQLYTFCKDEELNVKREKNSLIVEVPAAEGFEKSETNVFISEYSFDKRKESSQVIAMGLATLKNAESNGEVRYIISPEGESEKAGKDYFRGDTVTSIVHWNKTEIFTESSGITGYKMVRDVEYNSPHGDLAYEIKIDGVNEENDRSGNRSKAHRNPVTTLSDMLSSIRNSGVNIEIASFDSKGEADIYPHGADTVIVVDKNAQTKVEKKLENTKNSFLDDVMEKDEGASFEYKIVNTPDQVLDYDDSSEVMSLLYTLIDGVFATSEPDYEGDVLGVSSIYNAVIGDRAEVDLIGRYLSEDVQKDMDMTYKATAQLSDFKLKKYEKDNLWSEDDESEFFKENRLKKALESKGIDRKYKSMLEYDVLSFVDRTDKDSNKMIFGVNIDEATQDVTALIDYLDLTDIEK